MFICIYTLVKYKFRKIKEHEDGCATCCDACEPDESDADDAGSASADAPDAADSGADDMKPFLSLRRRKQRIRFSTVLAGIWESYLTYAYTFKSLCSMYL